jgi:hypothetical protein
LYDRTQSESVALEQHLNQINRISWRVPGFARGNGREGRPVTALKQTLALSRSLAARARARIAERDQEIERLQRTEEPLVAATGAFASPDARHGSCWVTSPGT